MEVQIVEIPVDSVKDLPLVKVIEHERRGNTARINVDIRIAPA